MFKIPSRGVRPVFLPALILFLAACQPTEPPVSEPESSAREPAADINERFAEFSEKLLLRWLDRSPEWSIFAGRYENAEKVTIPDAERRADELAFITASLAGLAEFDPESLSPELRIDHRLLTNRLEARRWYQNEFRDWAWNPANYNVAGPIGLILNTDYAPEDERLATVLARLKHVPAYYAAARENVDTPTLEHIELAVIQNRGTLGLLGGELEAQVADSALDDEQKALFGERLQTARETIEDWIGWLERLHEGLAESGDARSFRIGAELYEPKFAYDIQSDFSAVELYRRAVEEKHRLHDHMAGLSLKLWPRYFPDEPMPEDRLERIGRLIDHLSDRHVNRDEFIDEIKRQVPVLEEFVRENDLVDQDPTRPLVVRETPEYMRGGGAGASVSAPGPFNPTAETYYNVTPLDDYSEAEAASYLREYNHWVLQILNIHEAIPGHYTQLLHANKTPSLVKSLIRNGAMIEGWAVYAERMMLEEGWGAHEPEMWLMYGKWNLRVVTNAILDYAVHVLGMEEEEAMDLLMRQAFQERTEAINKWRRVRLSQVQLTSYFTGYAEIYDFRERLRVEQGENFDLKAFHNEFLSHGNAPVPAIVELMTQ